MKRMLFVMFLAVEPFAHSGQVFKCVAQDGKTVFSQHGCGDQPPVETLTPKAARPSGAGASVRLADPKKVAPSDTPRARRTYNHCGELTQVDIVYANNRGQVLLGMTGDDVRASWGPPASINRSATGEQWVYPLDQYRNRYAYIDVYGCFVHWN